MNDKFISYEEIDNDMKQIEEIGKILTCRLGLIEQNLVYIFSQIKLCNSVDVVQEYFKCLDRIQAALALIVHKENISISDRLWRFMSDFDNFEEAEKIYFEKIKNGEYVF